MFIWGNVAIKTQASRKTSNRRQDIFKFAILK